MKKDFAHTKNFRNLVAAITALINREDSLPGLGLVYGKPGFGKSTAVEKCYADMDVFCIVMERLWRPRRLLEEICDILNLGDGEYRLDKLSDQVCAGLKRYNKPLLIDEADYLLKNSVMLDMIRDIHEKTRVPIVLIGMENLYKNLQKYGQFFSRILPAAIVEFQPATPDEIVTVTKTWTGLSIGYDDASAFCQYVEGDYRYIVGYLLSLERACKTNGTNTIDKKMIDAVVNRRTAKSSARRQFANHKQTIIMGNQPA